VCFYHCKFLIQSFILLLKSLEKLKAVEINSDIFKEEEEEEELCHVSFCASGEY
jgi:hypothetical protein